MINWVPLAVFGIVAKTIALEGFEPFKKLGALVIAVLVQTSGPLYFLSDYYFLPEKLVPVYRLTLYFLLFHLLITQLKIALGDRTRKEAIERFVIFCSGLMLLLISVCDDLCLLN